MNKKRKIIAALADLKQDIAGPIPVEIVSKWTKSKKTELDQVGILAPHERLGYIVSSDSSGLSRLTAERTLFEVMKIVSEPKEILFQMGSSIGGYGVGVWAADNSQMFYPEEKVGVEQLLDTMSAAQKVIHMGPLQVGMAVHRGRFWEIGGGMFGEDADLVELIAEDYTGAKEIMVSESVRKGWDVSRHELLALREDLGQFNVPFYALDYDDLGKNFHEVALPAVDTLGEEHFYPFPFTSEFFMAMKKMETSDASLERMQKYFATKTVLLIKVYHKKMRYLLDQLTDWVVVNAILNEIAVKYDVNLVKSNGELAIFVADKNSEAVALAEDVLMTMKNSEDTVSIGLARVELLVFDLDSGGRDIAGSPVNRASKVSEDIEDENSLYVEGSVEVPATHLKNYEPFEMERSGVVLRGVRYLDML
jgi:hypothetical protein